MFKNLVITCFLGLVAVVLGAFGAHGFKEMLSSAQFSSFETAVRYQMYHVIVLLFVNTYAGFSLPQKNKISYLFFGGILLFSGSIYVLQLTTISAKSIWFITPLGGGFLIAGWSLLILIFFQKYFKK